MLPFISRCVDIFALNFSCHIHHWLSFSWSEIWCFVESIHANNIRFSLFLMFVQFMDQVHVTSSSYSLKVAAFIFTGEWSLSIVSGQKGEYVHLPVKRSSLAMWRIMFSSGITDGNIKIGDTAWRFNNNGCTRDLFLFKSFSPGYKQYALGLASVRITS